MGYLYFKQSDYKNAIKYFQLEEQTYPESAIFMKRMVQSAELREKAGTSTSEDYAAEDKPGDLKETGGGRDE